MSTNNETTNDYPKIMHRGLEEVTVQHATEEAEKREAGFSCPGDPSVAVADTEPASEPAPESEPDMEPEPAPKDEPTFGPPDDQTHERRPARGVKKK